VNGILAVPEFAFAFVMMVGVLITVHEFGHFLAAKLCGVRVLKFSIGFGPPIGLGRFRLAWRRSGTEYTIAWFPLGGFVRMLGDTSEEALGDRTEEPDWASDPELARQTLGAKPIWQKLFIIFAGPAMNLLLPVAVLWGTLAVGVDRPSAVVGTVERGSPAEAAGLLPGDRIAAVDGEPVAWWDEVEAAIRERPAGRMTLALERPGAPAALRVELDVAARPGLDIFRDTRDVGWLGLQHARQKAVLGITDAASPAARAGLQSGDRVVAVAGREVGDWNELAAAYAAFQPISVTSFSHSPTSVRLTVERGAEGAKQTREVEVPALGSLERLGAIPAVVLVASVSAGMPAAEAGLVPGDLIVAVDGQPIGSFVTFQETVFASQGRTLAIQVAKDGATRTLRVAPRRTETEVAGTKEDLYLIGIQGENAILPGAAALDRELDPLVALPRAASLTWDATALFLRGLKKLVTGEISRKNLGGPIEIARQSQLALQRGFQDFLQLLVLISINLGILNLLPIPILDGGQALVFTVEAVKRGPLSARTREIVQQVGLVFLVMLMGFAFWNDLSRHWASFVEWLRNLS
jgi:regulator of sigma E protease